MHPRTLAAITLAATLCACAGADEPAEEPIAPEPEPVAEPAPPPPAPAPEDDRARAIRLAEEFVRAQGYADAPPSVPESEIVHEGIEGTIADRRNTLDPHAVSASGQGEEWMVFFRYVDPRYEDRGRALRLQAGRPPSFVHQDVILSAID